MIHFAHALAVLWSVGCFGLPLWVVYKCFDADERGMALSVLLIGWPLGCLFAVAPWALMGQAQSPNLVILKKNEWVCSESHSVTTSTMMVSGKSMIPIITTRRVCDQYNRTGDL